MKSNCFRKIFLFLLLINPSIFSQELTIKVNDSFQTMDGFGASIAWADGQLASHPKKEEIYDLIFNELGLDILRLKGNFTSDTTGKFASAYSGIVQKLYEYAPDPPKILITSWSPPSFLKSNNATNNGGTLKKVDGKYVYGAYAKWWVDGLKAYKKVGIEPEYISLQNELQFKADWESCLFDPSENTTNAGYDRALDSVYNAIQKAGLKTQIIGPEVHGIGYNAFQNFAQKYDHSKLAGYCYHLYHGGGDMSNPDLFNSNLSAIASRYKTKFIWQTEFDQGDWLQTAWLINNCLTKGNVSGYLWWELVWGTNSKPLVEMQSNNYTVSKYYWAFRQFSKYISAGWKRVSTAYNANSLKISAFINQSGNNLSVVIVNTNKTQSAEMTINCPDFNITGGSIIRTSASENGVEISNTFNVSEKIVLPAYSITTLSLTGLTTGVTHNQYKENAFILDQNYPNPFNPSTQISYYLPQSGFVTLKIYDMLGKEIQILVNEFQQSNSYIYSFNAEGLTSGIYFYTLQVGSHFSAAKTMMLLK